MLNCQCPQALDNYSGPDMSAANDSAPLYFRLISCHVITTIRNTSGRHEEVSQRAIESLSLAFDMAGDRPRISSAADEPGPPRSIGFPRQLHGVTMTTLVYCRCACNIRKCSVYVHSHAGRRSDSLQTCFNGNNELVRLRQQLLQRTHSLAHTAIIRLV